MAQRVRCYERGQLLILPEHRALALALRQRPQQRALAQEFDAWGPEAREFHVRLNSRPVRTNVQIRRLLKLAQLYGRTVPKRAPKAAIVRLFDCDFIPRHGCAVLIGPTGTGKTHLLNAFGYTACERNFSVHYARVVDMLNHLTTAQINGRLAKALKTYLRPQLLLLDLC